MEIYAVLKMEMLLIGDTNYILVASVLGNPMTAEELV